MLAFQKMGPEYAHLSSHDNWDHIQSNHSPELHNCKDVNIEIVATENNPGCSSLNIKISGYNNYFLS